MCATQTRITREKVVETETYKGLSKIQKSIAGSRNNIQQIQNGINISKNIGFEKWRDTSNAYYVNKLIIEELLKDE